MVTFQGSAVTTLGKQLGWTGDMADFKPIVGYLALTTKTGILPVHLSGTHEAMPKGSGFLKSREVGARVGPFLPIELLEQLTHGLQKSEANRLIAAFVKRVIENLRDGVSVQMNPTKVRACWNGEILQGEPSAAKSGEEVLVHTGD